MSLFEDVAAYQEVVRCRCDLRAGMDRAELVAMGGGCRMPSYACPALDKYRRLLKATPMEPTTAAPAAPAAPTEAAPDPEPQGWSPWDSQVRRG